MVKDSTLRWILTFLGLVVLMLILISESSPTSKGIGIILGILFIAMGVIATTPLKRYFEETREGNMNPSK